MIRILIAEDHGVMRAGLEQLLANCHDLEVVATAGNGHEAIALVAEHSPDVVLMDLCMPELDGMEATKHIVAKHAETNVVVLTSFSDRERILEAVDSGAAGYLLKDAEPEDLLSGIRAAARGEAPLAPKVAKTVLSARVECRPNEELSEREREVLILLGQGLVNKQIARRLGISEKTVKTHIANIFRRIGVDDRISAALWAQRRGLLDQPPAAS